MGFPSALSAGNQNTKRAGGSFEHYLIVHTPTVQFQCNPNANASSAMNAEIGFSATLQGNRTNCLLGMMVAITPTSDYQADLRDNFENCEITYIRAAATATVLNIGATKYQFTTSDYVTVLDTYYPQKRLARNDGLIFYKDWTITPRRPKPRLYNLEWQVYETSTATYDVAFSPSADAMVTSGTISSWLWNVEDGTFQAGNVASQSPTVRFPTGTRNVHLTATNSSGVSNYLSALVAIIPSDLEGVIHIDNRDLQISKSLDGGNRASVTVLANASDWVIGSQVAIVTKARYADGTSALTVSLSGWIRTITDSLSPDGQKQASIEITDIASFMSDIKLNGFSIERKSNPIAWGHLARTSPMDALWHVISEHSTFANVVAWDFPSDYTDYQIADLNTPESNALDITNILSFKQSGAMPNWSPNGAVFIRQSLLYASSTDRDAATVYGTYEHAEGDCFNFGSNNPPAKEKAFDFVKLGSACYNTTTKSYRVFNSKAPAGDIIGELSEKADGIYLKDDLSLANAKLAAGAFAGNHYFAANENLIVSCDMPAGYYTIEPSCFQWHQFVLAESDSVSGLTLTTNERFLCLGISLSYDVETGTIQIQAEFRKETDGTDNYLQESIYVPLNLPSQYAFAPISLPYPNLNLGIEESDLYGGGTIGAGYGGTSGAVDPTQPPKQSGKNASSGYNANDEILVPFTGQTISSNIELQNGVSYLLRITGEGGVAQKSWRQLFDFSLDAYSTVWAIHPSTATSSYVAGVGYYGGFIAPNSSRLRITASFSSSQITRVTADVFAEIGGVGQTRQIGLIATYQQPTESGRYTFDTGEVSIAPITGATILNFIDGFGTLKDVYIYSANIYGTGTNPFAVGQELVGEYYMGDAFYYKYNYEEELVGYGLSAGLFIDGAKPTAPEYDPSHSYELTVVGDGSTLQFQFIDPDSDYTDNTGDNMRIEIIQL